MKKIKQILALVCILGIMICMVPMQTSAATKIKLNKTSTTLYVGSSTTLKISGTTAKMWSSNNTSIATVTSKGVVTAKKAGTATITCTGKNNKKYTCKVTVKNPYLNTTAKTLYVGSSTTLKITGTSAKQWTSRNKSVATVDSKGVVTAKNAGVATIACTGKNGRTYTCSITVKNPYLNATAKTLYVGSSTTLKITGTGVKQWTSRNKSVATVDSKGVVTAKSAGVATIACTGKNGRTYTCKVTVKNPYLNTTAKTVHIGKTYTLKITGTTASKWSSSNTSIATVNSNGVVTAKKGGTTTITCVGKNGKSYTCKVTVQNHSYTTKIVRNATCTTEGYKEHKCSSCGNTYKTTINKLNHDYSEKIITPDSCTTDGLKELTCSRKNCKDHKTETIKSSGHDYKLLNTVEPICGTDGYKEYQCSKCKNPYKETLTKLTHDYKLIKTVNATCSVDGYKKYECSNCKDSYNETINKTNVHNYDMTKEINRVESTCKTKGYIEYKCKNCDNLYKKTLEIDSSKHDYEETKTDLMYKYSICKHCKDEIKEYNDVEYEIDMGNGKTKTVIGHYDLEMAAEIGRLVNELRTKYDVAPAMDLLGADTKLGQAALIRAREIAVLVSHTRPNGENVLKSMTTTYGVMSENLTVGPESAQAAVNAWKNSPEHAMAQINDKYKNLAVAVFAFKSKNGYYYHFIELFQ